MLPPPNEWKYIKSSFYIIILLILRLKAAVKKDIFDFNKSALIFSKNMYQSFVENKSVKVIII